MITKQQAIKVAIEHTAQVPFAHPDYCLNFELTGNVGEDWLFAYTVECLKEIPPEEQEHFAGAAGFIVSLTGQVQDLSTPMFLEAEQKVNPK